ncbi:hypothetical protein AB0F91_41400 [Amycolatopsis sp. NPDC023774]
MPQGHLILALGHPPRGRRTAAGLGRDLRAAIAAPYPVDDCLHW